MVYKSGLIFLPFCQGSRVWRTDRRTDRILLAIPRLHYMQCFKNPACFIHICLPVADVSGRQFFIPNIIACCFFLPGLISSGRTLTSQLPSSGTGFQHVCVQPPLRVDSLEMGLQPISLHTLKSVWILNFELWTLLITLLLGGARGCHRALRIRENRYESVANDGRDQGGDLQARSFIWNRLLTFVVSLHWYMAWATVPWSCRL